MTGCTLPRELCRVQGMQDGLYFIRSSKTRPGEFALILCYGGGPHHFKIVAVYYPYELLLAVRI